MSDNGSHTLDCECEICHAQMFAGSAVKTGEQYRWDYPEEFTSLDDYSAHRGQIVTVLRPCTLDEADVVWDRVDASEPEQIMDRMFKVQAADGWIGDAWESELATC